ncbi:MAG TPA: 6-carboxytetrahydropterin synthase [Haliangiales bacterium]|nr:6-carboxytetrahydropterin synthase [Haliangiales bacterium]
MIARRRLFVGQDPHKFSVAHMTVFPDGSKEKLHGHNFQVTVALDLRDASLATLIDIGIIKKALEALCREWNEHLLLAEGCPALEILRRDEEVEIRLCGRRYVLPAEDVVFLPVDNIVVETLSAEVARRLVDRLGPVLRPDVVAGVEVEVREAPGQGGSTYVTLS